MHCMRVLYVYIKMPLRVRLTDLSRLYPEFLTLLLLLCLFCTLRSAFRDLLRYLILAPSDTFIQEADLKSRAKQEVLLISKLHGNALETKLISAQDVFFFFVFFCFFNHRHIALLALVYNTTFMLLLLIFTSYSSMREITAKARAAR